MSHSTNYGKKKFSLLDALHEMAMFLLKERSIYQRYYRFLRFLFFELKNLKHFEFRNISKLFKTFVTAASPAFYEDLTSR